MTKKPASLLGSSIIATKGKAEPAPSSTAAAPQAVIVVLPATAIGKLTAVTVRLDAERYRKLRMFGLDNGNKTNQDIFVAALDAYLAAQTK